MKISFPEHHLFQLLKRFENQHLPLDLFMGLYFRSNAALGSKDRQLISQAVYGMTRWKGLLDYLIGPNPLWEQRYALFKTFQPKSYLCASEIPMFVKVSFPKELYTLLEKDYGFEKAIEICQACNSEAPFTVRINPLKTSRDYLLKKWEKSYQAVPCRNSAYGIQFKKRFPITSLPEFKEGLFEIQDEASQLVADLVEAQSGHHVLDYCCGSGGKTLAFAHKLLQRGQIYLHDIRQPILEQARKRLRRAGIQNAQILPPNHTALQKIKKKMDWVLVDAPCTGTGTLRRNPDQKWKFSHEFLIRMVELQRSIFEEALSYVKPKGKIVYATCSMLTAENEKQITHFIKHYEVDLMASPFVSIPTQDGMDGFFAAVLRKR